MPKKETKQDTPANGPENNAVEALTVGWVLSMLFAFVFDLAAVGTRLYLSKVDPESQSIAALHVLTFMASFAMGVLCLILTPLVRRMRTDMPPTNVTLFALAVSLFPFLTLIFNLVSAQPAK